ncbi:hypothetical protein KSP39_PZI015478 [Platanthera zijinensis]|uniref:MULE transposase domain-containing protein n=1 Tax=Platanthera zijinensis TaxID=2320716 RepID=A0AAP0G1B0_9ASPA
MEIVPHVAEEPSISIEIDVGMNFVTDTVFPTKESLLEWVRDVAKGLSFVVTIQRADKIDGRPKPRVFMGCDRSGFARDNQQRKGYIKKNLRKTSSKRCECQFLLLGQRNACGDEWKIDVKNGKHNHQFVHLEAHSYATRLTEEEERIVEEMYGSGVKPRKILTSLKNRSSNNASIMRTIYNQKVKLQKRKLDGGTPIQFLYKCIRDAEYSSYNHVNPSTCSLESLYFAHPTSIRLCNMFPDVFVMDCTYKTNRYRLPLLSIVGQTSTNLSFFAAFETENSYKWAFECFKSMLDATTLPNVLIVDREIALMNAIKVVFPQAKIILCQVHINKNILAHCKKYFKKGKECEVFLTEWQTLVYSPSVHDFNMRLNDMCAKYAENYPDVLKYVVTTWVDPYKEYFVSAWDRQVVAF